MRAEDVGLLLDTGEATDGQPVCVSLTHAPAGLLFLHLLPLRAGSRSKTGEARVSRGTPRRWLSPDAGGSQGVRPEQGQEGAGPEEEEVV